jgi:hypothetical protein
MNQYAIIDNNKIINLIVAEDISLAEKMTGMQCIDVTNGWDHDSTIDAGIFFPTPIPE